MSAATIRHTSRAHPGDDPWPLVYGRALLHPMAVCLLPVMIASLVAVLEGLPLTPYVWWGAALALACASAWTSYRLRLTLAEVVIAGGDVAVRSIHDAATADRPGSGDPVLDVREYGTWSLVTVGLTSYELNRDDWPDYDALIAHLRSARHEYAGAAAPPAAF